MSEIKTRLTITSAVKDLGQLELSYTDNENIKWYSHFGKSLKTVSIYLIYDPDIHSLLVFTKQK